MARGEPPLGVGPLAADEVGVERVGRALDGLGADGVGPVKHHERLVVARARLHRVRHRPHERVEARADVLDVKEDRVDEVELLLRRREVLAVEAVHGALRQLVRVVRDRGARLLVAAQPVLGRKERDELERHRGVQRKLVGQEREVLRDRRRVRDHADPLAAQQRVQLLHLLLHRRQRPAHRRERPHRRHHNNSSACTSLHRSSGVQSQRVVKQSVVCVFQRLQGEKREGTQTVAHSLTHGVF